MNGSAADPLSRYYEGTPRTSPTLDPREGIRGRVDSLLAHLRIPCSIDPDGDWLIENDAGRFMLFARDVDERIVLRQKVMTLHGAFEDYADDLELLMELNIRGEGACFASQPFSGGYMVVITGQLPWEGLDSQKLGGLFQAAFQLSTDLDEALGDEEHDAEPVAAKAVPEAEAVAESEPVPEVEAVMQVPEVEALAGVPRPEPEPDHLGVAPSSNGNGNGGWPANWYDDPRGEARLRYWDGSAWTDHTAV